MKTFLRLTLFAIFGSLFASTVVPQLTVFPAGKVDRSFGDGGTKAVGPAYIPGEVIRLSSGKLVWISSEQPFTSGLIIHVLKTSIDGDRDTSFGPNGSVDFSFGLGNFGISAAEEAGGSLIVVGSTQATGDARQLDIVVFRVRLDGTLDPNFGTGGSFIKNFGTANEFSEDSASAVAVLPDGKILVGATSTRYSTYPSRGTTTAEIIRLNPNGTIDTSFGTSGLVELSIGNNQAGTTFAQHFVYFTSYDDGRFLAAFNADRPTANGFLQEGEVARFFSDGSLDKGFGNGGRLLIPYLPNRSFLHLRETHENSPGR